ncbi:hypothetical protein HPP92_021288 [Vanilla planifolia]|uniref:Uncharacterized protein n=1 Tax=Vanilla planifolia TaxID=51239 RepID=A0A835UIU1_VANPL|nr:hypothetical protein HPP92_021288 [Vanilla planifolia]
MDIHLKEKLECWSKVCLQCLCPLVPEQASEGSDGAWQRADTGKAKWCWRRVSPELKGSGTKAVAARSVNSRWGCSTGGGQRAIMRVRSRKGEWETGGSLAPGVKKVTPSCSRSTSTAAVHVNDELPVATGGEEAIHLEEMYILENWKAINVASTILFNKKDMLILEKIMNNN